MGLANHAHAPARCSPRGQHRGLCWGCDECDIARASVSPHRATGEGYPSPTRGRRSHRRWRLIGFFHINGGARCHGAPAGRWRWVARLQAARQVGTYPDERALDFYAAAEETGVLLISTPARIVRIAPTPLKFDEIAWAHPNQGWSRASGRELFCTDMLAVLGNNLPYNRPGYLLRHRERVNHGCSWYWAWSAWATPFSAARRTCHRLDFPTTRSSWCARNP